MGEPTAKLGSRSDHAFVITLSQARKTDVLACVRAFPQTAGTCPTDSPTMVGVNPLTGH
jgi:hypothetical protein